MKRMVCLLVMCMWCAGGAAGQTRRRVAPKKPATAGKTAQPKFKAIWEPINYPDDLTLMSVFFVNDQVGWIAGGSSWSQGGFILQTKDGGDHWAVQLGDPKSSDPSIKHLRFVDATHGWAIQGEKFVTTSDGGNWEDSGPLPPRGGVHDYTFTSPTQGTALTGFDTDASMISLTNDGGRTWKRVFQCATKLEINGLTQNVGCALNALHFPTPSVGYAVGGSEVENGPGTGYFVVARTEDGGENWSVVYAFATVPHADVVFFTSATTGFTRNNDAKFYMTTDGGASWKGVTGDANEEQLGFAFHDPEVGWAGGRRRLGFTLDGGKHWNSRDLRFPADVLAFSFPSRQRGYVVGQHGMIYRYRVVPFDYTAKGLLEAPMVPAKAATPGPGN